MGGCWSNGAKERGTLGGILLRGFTPSESQDPKWGRERKGGGVRGRTRNANSVVKASGRTYGIHLLLGLGGSSPALLFPSSDFVLLGSSPSCSSSYCFFFSSCFALDCSLFLYISHFLLSFRLLIVDVFVWCLNAFLFRFCVCRVSSPCLRPRRRW